MKIKTFLLFANTKTKMENTPKKKKSWLKLLVAFVAGAIVTAVVLMATTGTLFSGNIFRVYDGPKASDQLRINADDLKSVCLKNACQVEDSLTKEMKNLEQRLEDFKLEVRSANYSGQLNTLEANLNQKLDAAVFTSANLTGKFNMLKENFLNHSHTASNTGPVGYFNWW
jgi:hypothetical protein